MQLVLSSPCLPRRQQHPIFRCQPCLLELLLLPFPQVAPPSTGISSAPRNRGTRRKSLSLPLLVLRRRFLCRPWMRSSVASAVSMRLDESVCIRVLRMYQLLHPRLVLHL